MLMTWWLRLEGIGIRERPLEMILVASSQRKFWNIEGGLEYSSYE